jgi:hypothetical protein
MAEDKNLDFRKSRGLPSKQPPPSSAELDATSVKNISLRVKAAEALDPGAILIADLGLKDFELVGTSISPKQLFETLVALADFYRACGGIGLAVGTFGVRSDE